MINGTVPLIMITMPIDTMQYKIPAFTVDSIVQHLAPDTVKVSI